MSTGTKFLKKARQEKDRHPYVLAKYSRLLEFSMLEAASKLQHMGRHHISSRYHITTEYQQRLSILSAFHLSFRNGTTALKAARRVPTDFSGERISP